MKKIDENFTTPNFITKLREKMGAKEAAAAVGCSDATIYSGIREDRISLAYELAAECVFSKKWGKVLTEEVAIVSAPPHVCKTIEDLVTNLGGKFHKIP